MCGTRPGNEWLVCRYWEDQSDDDGDEEGDGDVDDVEQGDLMERGKWI